MPIIRKTLILLFVCFECGCFAQSKFHRIVTEKFHSHNYFHGTENPEDTIALSFGVDEIEVSDLVTWKYYKVFLSEVSRTKGPFMYEQCVPKLPADILNDALHSKKYDKEAVTGVSWRVAREYAKWKTVFDNKKGYSFKYRLPSIDEWLFTHKKIKSKTDIDKGVAEWTLSAKDESYIYARRGVGLAYSYEALESDPPALKRKLVMGKSISFSSDKLSEYSQISYYQDSAYNHVGFRLVKREADGDVLDLPREWACDYLKNYDPWLFGGDATYSDSSGKIEYSKELYGRLTGPYTSYYPNGKVKVKGHFYNHMRLGKWEVYDSLGHLIQTRNYTDRNSFTITKQSKKTKLQIALQNKLQYFEERDDEGKVIYDHLSERDIFFAVRFWSKIESDGNRSLFRQNYLLRTLSTAFKLGEVTCYDTLDDQFRTELMYEEYQKRVNGEAIRFELKTDFFYDISRNYGDSRIIGICPVVFDSITKKEVRLGWFYFPQVRSVLRKAYVNPSMHLPIRTGYLRARPNNYYYPYNLDDLFFAGDFEASITKMSSYVRFDDERSDSETISPFYFIELEHDLWLNIADSHSPQKNTVANIFRALFGLAKRN